MTMTLSGSNFDAISKVEKGNFHELDAAAAAVARRDNTHDVGQPIVVVDYVQQLQNTPHPAVLDIAVPERDRNDDVMMEYYLLAVAYYFAWQSSGLELAVVDSLCLLRMDYLRLLLPPALGHKGLTRTEHKQDEHRFYV